jgi:hypothetical protein
MKLRALALAVVVAAGGAWAIGPTEALRQTAALAKQQVLALKAQQLTMRGELSQVSSRVNELKAQNAGLLSGGELDRALKRSQELSASLTGLAQQVATKESELEAANLALLEGVAAEMTRLRAEFDRTPDRSARAQLLSKLKGLRAEREALRGALPVGRVPALEALKPTDDLDEVREQLDLARDTEEKVRKELKAVETRLAERAEERRLDRQMSSFLGEESMFDDQDRRLRVERQETKVTQLQAEPASPAASPVQTPPAARPPAAESTTVRDLAGAPPAPGFFGAAAEAGSRGSGQPTPAMSGDFMGGSGNTSSTRITQGNDARVQVGSAQRLAGGDEKDLDDLELQRAQLKGLAEQLKARAKALESKATALQAK